VIDKDSFIVNETDHYTGAYVFTPVPGLYDMVVSFDFSSLYPSTIIAYNIDYSTLVMDDTIPDDKCHLFNWEEHILCEHDKTVRKTKPKQTVCANYKFRFLKEPAGVIPTLLRNLLDARKKTNAEIKRLKSSLPSLSCDEKALTERLITVLDKRQLSYKVSANSVSPNTPIPCIDGEGKFMYLTMEEISGGLWISDSEKNEVSHPKKDLSVWTEKGYTKIKYVIRHPIRTPLKRVLTHTGCVDVTDEHSLLDDKGKEVKPIDLSIGDKLMHRTLPLPHDTPSIPMCHTIHKETIETFDLKGVYDYEKAFLWGLFFAEGTAGTWGVLEKAKSSWIIYNLDFELLSRAKNILEKVEGMTFMITFYESAGVYHLKPVGNKEGEIVNLCRSYRKLFYDCRGSKRIPSDILQADYYTRQSFFMGYYAGDGARFLEKGVVIHNKGEIGTAGLCYLAKSLGYIVSISYAPKKESIYRLQCCTEFRNKNTTAIKTILPSTPIPHVKKLQPDIIRNNTKIFFIDDNVVMYRNVKINCERIPRQKLVDEIDRLINIMKKRQCSIIEYYTDSKKIKYQTWCCGKQSTTGVKGVTEDNTTYIRICNCNKNILDDGLNVLPSVEDNDDVEDVEYIYDIETENHHFAAGVGDLIVHNSMYGGMGVKKGYLPFLPGAMCTTARGRESIEKASKFLTDHLGAKLIYGDSVTGDTPILVRYEDQTVDILRIDEIGEVWKSYDEFKSEDSNRYEKEQTLPFVSSGDFRFMNILEVWTGDKWSRVRRVIRHKTVKKMYRVLTHTGCVDVTEDHSLLDMNRQKIKPTEISVGSQLYHSFPPKEDFLEIEIKDSAIEGKVYECRRCKEHKLVFEFYEADESKKMCKECVWKSNHQISRNTFNQEYISETEYTRNPSRNLNEDLAFVWGMFFAEGSCGSYTNKTGKKNSWAINNQDLELLNKCKIILEKCEPIFGWKILDTMQSSSVYKLVPSGNLSYIVNKWRRLFYDREGYKKVPYFILNGSDDWKTSFFDGYYQGDGDRHTHQRISQYKFDIKGKIGALGLYTLLHSIGHRIAMNVRSDKDNIYTLHTCKNFRADPFAVKKIISLPESSLDDFVYDIETEEGRFMGGVGQMILKNTDSCYISFPQYSQTEQVKDLDNYCRQVEEEMTSLFPKPMKFAYEEAIYWRYLILSKKRYMALKCDTDGIVSNKIEKRGVLLSRRDNSAYSRDVYSKIIMNAFYKKPLSETLVLLHDEFNRLCSNNVSAKDLTISKSIGEIKDYKIRAFPDDDKKLEKRLTELNIFDKDATIPVIRKLFQFFLDKSDEFETMRHRHPLEYLIVQEYINKALPSQVQLAEKMRKRGTRVDAGERLGYCVIESDHNIKDKLFNKIEDIDYFKEHSSILKIDSLYYTKLLINPVDEVLSAVYDQTDICKKYYKAREIYWKTIQEMKDLYTPTIRLVDE